MMTPGHQAAAVSSESLQPVTATTECLSCSNVPEKRQGVGSPGMLLAGESRMVRHLASLRYRDICRSSNQDSFSFEDSLVGSSLDPVLGRDREFMYNFIKCNLAHADIKW